MNAPQHLEVLMVHEDSQQNLPLATVGVQRYVWESRFGAMLIEVLDGVVYVNGDRVDRVRDMPSAHAMAQTTGDHP
jgi:hypothetical protein